jgi:hypothetical protein
MPNNVESTINFRDYYRFTRDLDFLRNVAYPFLKEVAGNWDGKLLKVPGNSGAATDYRYKFQLGWDEGGAAVVNPTSGLAFLRALYQFLVEAAAELGADLELQPRWRDVVDHLGDYATTEYQGKTVFDFGEGCHKPEGSVYPYNTYPFYPAATEGLDSKYRVILINTLATRPSYWMQENAFTQVFAAGASGGYPAPELIEQLRTRIGKELSDNGIVRVPRHSTVENAFSVNNVALLLLQSGGDCVRVFPVWDLNKDARFVDLHAQGAFLVSSEVKTGVVQHVRIKSEKGWPVTIQNPWPGKRIGVRRNGNPAESATGSRFTLPTIPHEEIELQPEA